MEVDMIKSIPLFFLVFILTATALPVAAQVNPDMQDVPDVIPPGVGKLRHSLLFGSQVELHWSAARDNVTPQKSLSYKLVYSEDSNLVGKMEDAEIKASVAMNWKENTLRRRVRFNPAKDYYYAVIVRDTAGNKALYRYVTFKISDTVPPKPGTMNYVRISSTRIQVVWSSGTDNVTPKERLDYKLVYSQDVNHVGNMSDAENKAAKGMNWSRNTLRATQIISVDRYYYFAVIVRDESGKKSLYPYISLINRDTAPPSIPSSPIWYTNTNKSDSYIDIYWKRAQDDTSTASELTYYVKKGKESALRNLLSAWDAATIGVVKGSAAIHSKKVKLTDMESLCNITPLSGSRGCAFFTVIVVDKAGNKALYPTVRVYYTSPDER